MEAHPIAGALVAILCAVCVWPAAASAQSADELIEMGVQLRRRGDDIAAYDRFARAYGVEPTARAAAQLGLCAQALGRWVEADRYLREALAAVSDPWVARNRASLESAQVLVRQQVGQLEILGSPAGARVRLAGRQLGTLPFRGPVTVQAGRAMLEVTAPGHHRVALEVSIRPGQLTRQTVELARGDDETADTSEVGLMPQTLDALEPPPGPRARGSRRGRRTREIAQGPGIASRWWFWTGLGVLVAGGVVTAVLVATHDPGTDALAPGTEGTVLTLRAR